jgi:hypothetical protein
VQKKKLPFRFSMSVGKLSQGIGLLAPMLFPGFCSLNIRPLKNNGVNALFHATVWGITGLFSTAVVKQFIALNNHSI